ncbi:hypothetical protein H920_11510 [Fukomys damarensis]|uniref:Uncharacterized protein n=1 Tax=Fukomys damarensis TaxID=885580 RepID=A0A091DA25_FUKDA|nr:hypothetical protein H920_11510 [Fukomys damarensis]
MDTENSSNMGSDFIISTEQLQMVPKYTSFPLLVPVAQRIIYHPFLFINREKRRDDFRHGQKKAQKTTPRRDDTALIVCTNPPHNRASSGSRPETFRIPSRSLPDPGQRRSAPNWPSPRRPPKSPLTDNAALGSPPAGPEGRTRLVFKVTVRREKSSKESWIPSRFWRRQAEHPEIMYPRR